MQYRKVGRKGVFDRWIAPRPAGGLTGVASRQFGRLLNSPDVAAALMFPSSHFPRSIVMPATPADVFALLDRLGIPHSTVEHTALFTVEESRALRGEIAGGHSKNLFVKDKKSRLFLITAREDAALDLKRLHEAIGGSGRVSFGSGELLEEVWGVRPGSVTPFGAINDAAGRVTVVIERALLAFDPVNFHPLVNTATTSLPAQGLLAYLRATGHEAMVTDLPLAQAG
jgi:Ala-tRNA(Pro) deacylase